ncbi:MAG: tRNA pseudouridine(65) synthase TruC, partial [Rhodothermales bacterium]
MLEVLYQDESYVAVNKPAGVLVHRSKIDPRETRIALQMVRDQVGRHVYPIHRLDKPTSGVLIFGLTKVAAQHLATAFAERKVQKTYIAIVRGYVDDAAEIDYPLKEVLDKKTDRKAQKDKPPQPAVTGYQRLAKVELPFPVGRYESVRYSIVKLSPKTGRKHQLRRHMKHIFHPILGDRKYGDWRHNNFLELHFGCRQLLLHAATLSFDHPLLNQRIELSAAPEALFLKVVAEMGFDGALVV